MVEPTLEDLYADMIAELIQEYDDEAISVRKHRSPMKGSPELVIVRTRGCRMSLKVECIRAGTEKP